MNVDLPEADAVQPSELPFPVVGIGASAGGIAALTALFAHMPARSGMAFVVVLHLSPKHESTIDQIIGRHTAIPVHQVTETTALEADHIYVISPALQLLMNDGHLHVASAERVRGRHVAIDVFFRTLAEVHRERAIAVVLSGAGADGSLGLLRIKEFGGVALVQTPSDAEYDDMPRNAIATGAADIVLPASDMAQRLVAIWANARRIALPVGFDSPLKVERTAPQAAERAEAALKEILVTLRKRTGHDFSHYKRATVLRRLERRLQVHGLDNLPAYNAYFNAHSAETPLLIKDLLISVTNFFRDPASFAALEHIIDTDDFGPVADTVGLRAWVAGCATGEEAYSVAMVLTERAARMPKPSSVQVFASDIDSRAIALGRTGFYPDTITADLPDARLLPYFVKEAGGWRVRKELRERILFAAHNLLHDPPFSNLDLVCCRNLLIYLDRTVQATVLELFHFALKPGACCFSVVPNRPMRPSTFSPRSTSATECSGHCRWNGCGA